MGKQLFFTPAQTARKTQKAGFDPETDSHLHFQAKHIAEGRVKQLANPSSWRHLGGPSWSQIDISWDWHGPRAMKETSERNMAFAAGR